MTHRPFSFLPPPPPPQRPINLSHLRVFPFGTGYVTDPVSSSFFPMKNSDVTKYEKGENKTIAAGVLLGLCEKKGAACGFLNAG